MNMSINSLRTHAHKKCESETPSAVFLDVKLQFWIAGTSNKSEFLGLLPHITLYT